MNNTMNATIVPNEIAVTHSVCGDREYLKFDISGWDDVKKLTKKVLLFDGRGFVFSCWNSDHNYCVFVRLLNGSTKIAKII